MIDFYILIQLNLIINKPIMDITPPLPRPSPGGLRRSQLTKSQPVLDRPPPEDENTNEHWQKDAMMRTMQANMDRLEASSNT